MKKLTFLTVLVLEAVVLFPGAGFAATPPWDGWVHAPLKTAQPYDWSAPDRFFTGEESADIKYIYNNDTFEGELRLTGFKQAGPYVLTVDTADGSTLAGYGCDIWLPWTQVYGATFVGGTNGCWNGSPYADVKLFTLLQYDSNGDGITGGDDYYGGTGPFDVPLLNGTYNLKFFVKLDWNLTSPSANIMMMNDMTGEPRYGKVVQPKTFNYDRDLIVGDGLGAERLVLADHAWCVPSCQPPSSDPGYQWTTGVVFYATVSDTFRGGVVLSKTVTPPTPQPLQIKLEGTGSLGADPTSNEYLGYIGRWWDNNTGSNISDSTYDTVKNTHNVLGYVVFDGFNTATTSQAFALDSSYHTLWDSESNHASRATPGNVVMADGQYVATFALTENDSWWRGVFLSENPVEFTIVH